MNETTTTDDKSWASNRFFYGILIFLALHFYLSINTDLAEFTQHKDINIPTWYFYIVFVVDALVLLSLVLIAMWKKVGVYAFPIFMVAHFLIHNYFLSTFLYSDVSVLFFFVGLGLLAIIPRWNNFK
ncbi:hypothetical protein ACK1KB_00285 [Chryseobacterium sp. TY3]